ncbi:sensor histidine kinase [Lysobacter humi (ex Lee et al. 2017)]
MHPDVLDAVVAACTVATAVLDADDVVLHANPAFTQLAGLAVGTAFDGRGDAYGPWPLPGHADGHLHARALDGGRRLVQWQPDGAAEQRQLQMFADTVAHDLKAPLRSIDSFAKLLEDRAAAKLDAAERMHLSRIRAAATRMSALLTALGELSRAASASMQPADVDLSLLAEWVLAELQDTEPAREVAIDVQPGLQARGDERLLKQMLRMLLENAWKFTRGRAQARIEVRGSVEDGRLRLVIRDTGSGFDMQYAHKLFQPFQRLHGIEQGAGHGLGLAIAQRIARRHGGDVRADSRVDAGSTFTVELPAPAGATG